MGTFEKYECADCGLVFETDNHESPSCPECKGISCYSATEEMIRLAEERKES